MNVSKNQTAFISKTTNMGTCNSETSKIRKESFISTASSKLTMKKKESRVCVEVCQDENLKDIFTVSSCPVDSLSIIDKVHELASKDKQIGIKFMEAKWKKVSYKDCLNPGYQFWGVCKWLNQMDTTLDGKAYFYKSNKTHAVLVAGIFKAGKLVLEQNHYKILDNGSHYYGRLNSSLEAHGIGELVNSHNNSVYKGSFLDGIPHGHCEFITKEKTFKGQFVRGQKSKGEEIGINGKYVGTFENNLRHGKGVLTLNCGVQYQGYFHANRRDGQGTLTDKNGKVVYSGIWAKDRMVSKENNRSMSSKIL